MLLCEGQTSLDTLHAIVTPTSPHAHPPSPLHRSILLYSNKIAGPLGPMVLSLPSLRFVSAAHHASATSCAARHAWLYTRTHTSRIAGVETSPAVLKSPLPLALAWID